jgi:hypothetical protein
MPVVQQRAGARRGAMAENVRLMKLETEIAPPNSLLFVMDRNAGELPETLIDHGVTATESCVAIGTLSAADGTTLVEITDENMLRNRVPRLRKMFGGILKTPGHEIVVCTVRLDTILRCPVPDDSVEVEIWGNDEDEPSIVCVKLGKSSSF